MGAEIAVRIPEKARKILRKSFAQVATLMPDGSPRVEPAWVEVEDDEIVINTAEGRMKPSNLRDDPRVAIVAIDPDKPVDAVLVRGWVSELTHDGAGERIRATAKGYPDEDEYPFRGPGRQRVRVHIEPECVSVAGQ
jgi:PPOX class probable F420-dependent enzyme